MCYFLLPLVGATTVSEIWHVDAFRQGPLLNLFGADLTMYSGITVHRFSVSR